jgi:hypothetical protein
MEVLLSQQNAALPAARVALVFRTRVSVYMYTYFKISGSPTPAPTTPSCI